jgi:hypothetical protein
LQHQGELGGHELRSEEDDFNVVLWRIASSYLCRCTFTSPLASFENRGGLRSSDLALAFNYIDRCGHLDPVNTRASGNRGALRQELDVLKLTYVRDMEILGVPAPVLHIFDSGRSIVEWFSPVDTISPITYDFAGEIEYDPLPEDAAKMNAFEEWLQPRKAKWRALLLQRKTPLYMKIKKRSVRCRHISEVSYLPPPVPWIEAHPDNGHASLTDQGAFIMRLLRADGGVSKNRQPVVFALMFTMMFRKTIPKDLIISAPAIDLSERRLSARDQVILMEEISVNLGKSPYALFYSLFDDTHYQHGERHVYFLTFYNRDKKTPESKLVSLKNSPGKDAVTNANEDMINIASLKLDVQRHGGSTSDHAAMAEGRELGVLVIAASAAAAASTGVISRRVVQAVIGDEMHKHPLIWKAIDEGTFGVDQASIQNRHHKQLLFQLHYTVNLDKDAILNEIERYMGLKGGSENGKTPNQMCETRWHLVGRAARSWLKRKYELDCRGQPAMPGLFRHMASREVKGSMPYTSRVK